MKPARAIALALAATLSACTWINDSPQDSADNKVNVGNSLPTFTVVLNSGDTLSTEALRGKPGAIIFFSTTCPDCRLELPALDRRYRAHGADTTFVAISREETDESIAAYWREEGLSLPYSAQADRSVYSLFARRGIPRIYLFDASGIVVECR